MAILEKATKQVYRVEERNFPLGTLADILINTGGAGVGDYLAVATVPTEPGNPNNVYWIMDQALIPKGDNIWDTSLIVGDGTHPRDGLHSIRTIILEHDWPGWVPLHENGMIAIEESPTMQWLCSHFAPAYYNLREALAIWGFLAVYNFIRSIINRDPYTRRARWAITGMSVGGAIASGIAYNHLFEGTKDIARTVTGKHYKTFDEAWEAVYGMLKNKMIPFWDKMALVGSVLKYLGYGFAIIAPIALYIYTRGVEKKIREEIFLR